MNTENLFLVAFVLDLGLGLLKQFYTLFIYNRVIRTPVDNLLGYIYDKGMCIGSMYLNGF